MTDCAIVRYSVRIDQDLAYPETSRATLAWLRAIGRWSNPRDGAGLIIRFQAMATRAAARHGSQHPSLAQDPTHHLRVRPSHVGSGQPRHRPLTGH
jgi:hypothetical protein